MQKDLLEGWTIWFFAIVGSFVLFGVCGLMVALYIGWDDDTVSGFFAAFGVVLMAYLAAPRQPALTSIVLFFVGALIAWGVLRPDLPPLDKTAYLYTLGGGAVALLLCLFPTKKGLRRAPTS